MQNKKSMKFQALAKQEQKELGKLILQKMSVEDYMADSKYGNPAVYVGTYRKYNEGSLFGMWVDLTACADYEEFIEVCHMLHADEEDPELMFQDYECFPESWYSESGIDEDTFDKIIKFANLDEEKQEAYEEYLKSFNDEDFSEFEEKYCGKWDSEKDFAEHVIEESYNLEDMMGRLASYFDYEAYATDLFIEDYYYTEHFVFRR